MPPLVLAVGVIGVAALHEAVGTPFGAAWAAEVWGLAKTAITAMLAVAGFGAYAHTNNRRAWELAEADESRRVTTPTLTPLPSVRQRRTGRLTPVESLGPGERVAPAGEVPDRHAEGRGGGPR